VSVSATPDAFGLLNFQRGWGGGGTSSDLVSAIAGAAVPSAGVAPARFTVVDNPWISYDWSYLAGWELVPQQGEPSRWQGVALTGALLFGNVVASSQFDGKAWFGQAYNFTLPRVPSATCALPLPSRIAGSAPSSTRGFNAITSEACTRTAMQPLLDLGFDLYVKNAATGPSSGDPFGWVAWAAQTPFQFCTFVYAQASQYLTVFADVSTPRSKWAVAGIATVGSAINAGAQWVIALLTGASAGAALYPAVPSGYNLLTTNPNISMAGLSVHAVASLQGAFLVDVTYNNNTFSSTVNTADAAWAAAKFVVLPI
jgi:hypothetical protein